MMQWFDVDRAGLAALMERRGKTFAVMELIQNAWDTGATNVNVSLSALTRGRAELIVEDDDPDGFADLRDAFTLFAPSTKKGDPTKRGRFNLGEKLVLALCDSAIIVSTKGGVRFDKSGRHLTRRVRQRGSMFTANIRLSAAEVNETVAACRTLFVPPDVKFTVNLEHIAVRPAIAEIAVTLPTEIADEDGILRRRVRKTAMQLIEPSDGEIASIYEMGIPIVETGDRFHYNVMQKVPLSLERDNVPPSYLLALRTAAVNDQHAQLSVEDANAAWARDALDSPDIDASAVGSILDARYGEKRAVYDPSDPEANKLAVMAGYTIIPPRSFSKAAWGNIREAGAALPAGRVTPSPRPFSADGEPLKVLERHAWGERERHAAIYAQRMGESVTGVTAVIEFADDRGWDHAAAYSHDVTRRLTINLAKVRTHVDGQIAIEFDALLIHEFAHERVSDHLSREFYAECCRIGAMLVRWQGRGDYKATSVLQNDGDTRKAMRRAHTT